MKSIVKASMIFERKLFEKSFLKDLFLIILDSFEFRNLICTRRFLPIQYDFSQYKFPKKPQYLGDADLVAFP